MTGQWKPQTELTGQELMDKLFTEASFRKLTRTPNLYMISFPPTIEYTGNIPRMAKVG
jgi:hypothetical protein